MSRIYTREELEAMDPKELLDSLPTTFTEPTHRLTRKEAIEIILASQQTEVEKQDPLYLPSNPNNSSATQAVAITHALRLLETARRLIARETGWEDECALIIVDAQDSLFASADNITTLPTNLLEQIRKAD